MGKNSISGSLSWHSISLPKRIGFKSSRSQNRLMTADLTLLEQWIIISGLLGLSLLFTFILARLLPDPGWVDQVPASLDNE